MRCFFVMLSVSLHRGLEQEKAAELARRQKCKKEIDEFSKTIDEIQENLRKEQGERDEFQRLRDRAVSQLEGLMSQRKIIVEKCDLEEIPLPRRVEGGRGDDGDDAMDVDGASGGDHTWAESISVAKQTIAKDRFDYSKLPRDERRELSDKERDRVRNDKDEEVTKIRETLNSRNPNMKAKEQCKEVDARYSALQEEFRVAKEKATKLTKDFEDAKATRLQLFNGSAPSLLSRAPPLMPTRITRL